MAIPCGFLGADYKGNWIEFTSIALFIDVAIRNSLTTRVEELT